MGLFSALISVYKIDDSFINIFSEYLSNEKINELKKENIEQFDKSRDFVVFSKLCILELVTLFRKFINEKKLSNNYSSNTNYINEFYQTPFERKIADFIASFDKKEDATVIKMIRIGKNNVIDIGTTFCIYAISQNVITNNSKDYIQKQSSELNNQILTVLRKFQSMESKAPIDINDINDNIENNELQDDTNREEFYFENAYEYMLFLGMKATLEGDLTKSYSWKNSEKYVQTQREAYQANENNDTDRAIKLLDECLSINPIGIGARFELVETFILRKDYCQAKKQLDELTKYINTRQLVARYYRRYGYISTEEKNYDLALGCFIVSLAFEESDIAKKEILYLSTQVPDIKQMGNDPFFAIANSNVKFFKNDMKEWLDSEVREKIKTIDDAKAMYMSICDNIATTLPNGEKIPKNPSEINPEIYMEDDNDKEFDLEDNEQICDNTEINEYIYCRKCGTKLPYDSVFCNKCGTKVQKI